MTGRLIKAGKSKTFLPSLFHSKIRKGKCLAFVGAGFSMACGMPGWKELLEDLLLLAKKSGVSNADLSGCKLAVKSGQYSLAASIIRRLLGQSEIDNLVRRRFSLDILKNCSDAVRRRMRARQKNLVGAKWAGILTTNFDHLIEDAFARYSQAEPITVQGNDSSLALILCDKEKGQKFFVKLHGSASTSFRVLCTEEYESLYVEKNSMEYFLTALMLSYHFVFIGCSLEDAVLRLRKKLCMEFEKRLPMAYSLLTNTALNRARTVILREDYLIEPLLYDKESPRTYGEHSAVDLLLREVRLGQRLPSVKPYLLRV